MSLKKRERRVQVGQRIAKSSLIFRSNKHYTRYKRQEGGGIGASGRWRTTQKVFGYLTDWLRKQYPDIPYVGEIQVQ